jgi:uncharacterized protein (TIGR00251 family)
MTGQPVPGGVVLTLKVQPRSSKPGILRAPDGTLKVRLQSPPVEGAANAELVELLSAAFDVPRRAITIVGGAQSRTKRVKLDGVDSRRVADLVARLTT